MEKRNGSDCRGSLVVVGTGPGAEKHVTPDVRAALAAADVIVGYKTYLDLVPRLIRGKEVYASNMRQEVDRCLHALDLAEQGKNVAVVSGGDPGIYAMAGLVLEMAEERDTDIDLEVVPGIAALNACAARLGAPLTHDFAAVSLSDLLTPWETIEKRLDAAASADFVIVLYNPRSKKRTTQIERARDIVLRYRPAETPVGIVTAATRETEQRLIGTLGDLPVSEIGMQSTVIIGNSSTRTWRGFMYTPRGYAEKYDLGDRRA